MALVQTQQRALYEKLERAGVAVVSAAAASHTHVARAPTVGIIMSSVREGARRTSVGMQGVRDVTREGVRRTAETIADVRSGLGASASTRKNSTSKQGASTAFAAAEGRVKRKPRAKTNQVAPASVTCTVPYSDELTSDQHPLCQMLG